MAIHPLASRGFAGAGEAYEQGRPSYPADAVACLSQTLGLGPGKTVVDLAAGTGKLTRLLAQLGVHLIAVEPVAGMRSKLVQSLPQITALDGTAESMPLSDGAADAVVAAQAFHWFRGDEALAEIHRVLRPGGRLGLIWNARDVSRDWAARLTEIVNAYEAGAPRYASGQWRAAFETTRLFTPLQERQFSYAYSCDADTILARVASISFIGALPEGTRSEVLAEVSALLQSHPQTRGQGNIEFPYRTDVFWCSRI